MNQIAGYGMKVIVSMYGYALGILSADYGFCQLNTPGDCEDSLREAVATASAAGGTWFAYLSKSPVEPANFRAPTLNPNTWVKPDEEPPVAPTIDPSSNYRGR
jgi:hypothetical protein